MPNNLPMQQQSNPFRERLSLLVPLNKLTPHQQDQLLAAAEVLSYRKHESVFKQGARDHWAYYLLSGELEMWAGDQLVKKIVGGEANAFQPLAQLQPRQMSATAMSTAQVLRVDRNLLDKLLSAGQDEAPPAALIEVAEYEAAGTVDWLTSLLQSPLFARIPPANIQRLLDTLETVECQAREVVIQQGAAGDYYYIIQSGTCEVCRITSLGKEIRLAELGPGDTFGEEALVSNATRNATVRMLSDGSVGRLTQEHFIELIRKPLLRTLDLAAAQALIVAGAHWLDVRFPEEHKVNGKPGSHNVPLSFLRSRLKELDSACRYVVYCDTGGRSSAAAFLLTQEGFDVAYVANGGIDELGHATAGVTLLPAVPASPPTATDQLVDAEARAQSLAAELAKADFQIEQAQRLQAAAAATKQAAERYVEQRLGQEHARLAHQAATLNAKLVEAQRLKETLEQQHAAARAEAARFVAAESAKAAALQQRIERALHEKEQRLEAVFRDQTERLETLHAEHAAAREALQEAWQKIELESSVSRERLAAAERLEQEILAREAAQSAQLAARERDLRETLKGELGRERQRFEAEFVKYAADLAHAEHARQAAEAAQQAAAAESGRIIAEYQAAHQQQLSDLQQRLAAERAARAADARSVAQNATQSAQIDTSEHELNLLVRQDLDEWVEEQGRLLNSTAERADLARQRAQTARIKARATAAKQAAEDSAFSLLDETAFRLDETP